MSTITSRRTVLALGLVGLAVALTMGWLARGSQHLGRAREEFTWTEVTSRAGWAPGYSFSAVVLHNTLWILGHHDGNWYSDDGRIWKKAASNVDFTSGYSTFVVFKDEIYAIGGADDQSTPGRKAVWKSEDGVRWVLLTDNPAWSARVWHASVVSDGRIWLLGGYDGDYQSDVWYSRDGSSGRARPQPRRGEGDACTPASRSTTRSGFLAAGVTWMHGGEQISTMCGTPPMGTNGVIQPPRLAGRSGTGLAV